MSNEGLSELKIMASIAPQKANWPAPDGTMHWQALHQAVDEARAVVREATAAIAAVDADPDLTEQGRAKRRAEIAAKALGKLNEGRAMTKARNWSQRALQTFDSQLGAAAPKPGNQVEADDAREIRRHIAALPKAERLGFIERNKHDPAVVAAVVHGRPWLSGLTDEAHRAAVRMAAQATAPEALRHREETEKALQFAEAGWRRAAEIIASQAGVSTPAAAGEAA